MAAAVLVWAVWVWTVWVWALWQPMRRWRDRTVRRPARQWLAEAAAPQARQPTPLRLKSSSPRLVFLKSQIK
eukprot:353337-Chlamydomonas_euryale.AAC.1